MATADLVNVGTHVLVGVWGVADPNQYKKSWPYTLAGAYVLTGPLVHWTKGRPDRAWKSLALRVGLPLATGLLGGLVSLDREESGLPRRDVLVGGVLGMAVAVIVDDAILAGAEGPEDPGTEVSRIQGVGPWVDLEGHGAGASFAYAL